MKTKKCCAYDKIYNYAFLDNILVTHLTFFSKPKPKYFQKVSKLIFKK